MTPAKATPAKASAKAAPKPSAKTAKSLKPGAKSAEKPAANAAEKAKAGHVFIGIGLQAQVKCRCNLPAASVDSGWTIGCIQLLLGR